MNALSLFTGIGVHDLGLQWAGMTIVGQCEIESHCLNVLRRHWPGVPRWRDVRDVNKDSIIERCGCLPGIVTGGFPCQQNSGLNNFDRHGVGTREQPTDRSGLVWQFVRIVNECLPRWICLENIPAFRVEGLDDVLTELEALGYACWPLYVAAEHAGAPHERKRLWIVGCRLENLEVPVGLTGKALADAKGARHDGPGSPDGKPAGIGPPGRTELAYPHGAAQHADPRGLWRSPTGGSQKMADAAGASHDGQHAKHGGPLDGREDVADPDGAPLVERQAAGPAAGGQFRWPAGQGLFQYDWEAPRQLAPERGVGRAANGHSNRLALEAIGNSNPPQVAYAIGRAIRRVDAQLADIATLNSDVAIPERLDTIRKRDE